MREAEFYSVFSMCRAFPRRKRSFTAGFFALAAWLIGTPALGQAPFLRQEAPKPAAPHPVVLRASDVIPRSAFIVMSVEDGAGVVRNLKTSKPLQQLLADPTVARVRARPELLAAQMALNGFAAGIGLDGWGLAEALAGENLAFGLSPVRGRKPVIYLAVRMSDQERLAKIGETVAVLTGATVGGEPAPDRSREVAGIRGYKLNEEAFFAVNGPMLLFSNRAEGLTEMIRIAAGERERSLDDGLETARKAAADAGQRAWFFVNMARLRPLIQNRLPEKINNPFAALLGGGWLERLRNAELVYGGLSGRDGSLVAEVVLKGGGEVPGTHQGFFPKNLEDLDWAKLGLPGFLGSIRLPRDASELWLHRDALVDTRGLTRLAEFANNLSNLLGGLDFGDDFLPQTAGSLVFLAAEPPIAGKQRPDPLLPSFALLIPLKTSESFKARLESAMTAALTFVGMQAAQNGQMSLLLDVDYYKEHKVIGSKYSPPSDETARLPIQHNFSPSSAVVGRYFVVASRREFLETIIDKLADIPASAVIKASDSYGTLDVRGAVRMLQHNKDALVAKEMVEKGVSKAEAEGNLGVVLAGLSMIDRVEMAVALEGRDLSVRAALTPMRGK